MKTLRGASSAIFGVLREAAQADRVQATCLLTMLLVVLHAGGAWYFQAPTALLAGLGLLVPRLRVSPAFWLGLTCVLAFGNFYNWFAVDNHKFLMTWWCLAIYCALQAPQPDVDLARQARWLLALCFLFAVVWKISVPDYLDGRFFRHTFLTDARFQTVAVYAGGADREGLLQNRMSVADLRNPLGDAREVTLASGPRVALVADLATWWTILIEAVLSAAFMLPGGLWVERVRHGLLLVFILTTYAVAPVIPYGWTLLMMGFANCPADWTRMRAGYVTAFMALQIYGTPFKPV